MEKIGRVFGVGPLLRTISVISVLCTGIAGASVNVQSMVDRNEMGMGDTLTLTVSVNSSESVDVAEPRMNNLTDFDLVNSWNASSTSSKLVQGPGGMQFETVRAENFNYMITPRKPGKLQIPAIEVVVEGKTYTTKSITIDVSKEGSGAVQGGGRGRGQQPLPGGFPPDEDNPLDEAEQMFQQLLQRRGGGGMGAGGGNPAIKALPKNANEALSIQVEVDKTDVYEGEQIVANWYIYTRGNLISLDRLKFPDLRGFWKEIIEEVPALNFSQEVINGIPYRKALLASHALFPIKPGVSAIDEYKIKGQVQILTNPFSSFGFGQTYSFQRSSDRIKINVKPLPIEGKPNEFSGAVGQFDVHASVEGNQFPVNQPFTLKVRFEGSGNAKLIELPHLNLPTGVELYDTKNESKYFKNGRSYKQFDVLIIPRQEGSIKIPAMSFSMFDPQTKRYISKTTEAIDINVIANPNAGNISSTRVASNGESKPKASSTPSGPELPSLLLTWEASRVVGAQSPQLWIFVFALALGVLFFKVRIETRGGQQRRNLKILMERRLKALQPAIQGGDYRKVGTEMSNLIYLILGDLSGQAGAGLDIQKLLDKAPPSLRREIGNEIARLIEIFQIMSFAPEGAVGKWKEPGQIKENVKTAMSLMQKGIAASEEVAGDFISENEPVV